MKRRSAFTLAELVVVMTAGSVLLTLAIGTVHRSLSIHRQGEQRDRDLATAARLSREFRRDLRQAAGAVLDAGKLTLSPVSGAREAPITYEVVEHRLVRRQRRGEGLERREVYEFDATAGITLASLPESGQIQLLITTQTPLKQHPSRLLLRVAATPGGGAVTP